MALEVSLPHFSGFLFPRDLGQSFKPNVQGLAPACHRGLLSSLPTCLATSDYRAFPEPLIYSPTMSHLTFLKQTPYTQGSSQGAQEPSRPFPNPQLLRQMLLSCKGQKNKGREMAYLLSHSAQHLGPCADMCPDTAGTLQRLNHLPILSCCTCAAAQGVEAEQKLKVSPVGREPRSHTHFSMPLQTHRPPGPRPAPSS